MSIIIISVIFAFIIFLLLIFEIKFIRKISKYLAPVCGFFILFIILGKATFNNDWIAYKELFEGIKPTYDLIYSTLFKIFRLNGFEFKDFYFFNQIIIFLSLLYFISKFRSESSLLICLSFLIAAGPNVSILLRYITAFIFFILSTYELYVHNNKRRALILFLISCLTHYSMICMIIFFPFYKLLSTKNVSKILIISSLLLFSLQNIVYSLMLYSGIGSFEIYIKDSKSSLAGGLLASISYFPWFFIIFLRHKQLLKSSNTIILNDNNYLFLYRLSIFPVIFILPALQMQIISYRFIEPFIFVWATYLCYSMNFSSQYVKLKFTMILIALIMLTAFLKYILPFLVLGYSEWIIHYTQILLSNEYRLFDFLIK